MVVNDKSEKKSRKPFVIVLVLVAIAILVFVTKKGCPIPIPVPADETGPTIEAKKTDEKKADEPIKLDPKVEVPVIGEPLTRH